MTSSQLYLGDCRDVLDICVEAKSIQTCITSPPYFGLRDYGHAGQIGLETTPNEYVAKLIEVFRSVREVLRDDGTLWLNLGDSYAGGGNGGGGSFAKDGIRCAEPGTDKNKATRYGKRGAVDGIKPKDLIGIPWRVAFALQADGWYLRQDIIWHKPNPMPESVTDRCTKAHEYVFMFSKKPRYFYDAGAVKEPAKDWSKGGPGTGIKTTEHYGAGNGGNSGLAALAGKYRSKRDSFKREGSKRAEAIPGQTVGTHRPERPESGHSLETRNRRSVWTIPTRAYKGAHFATFPPALVEPCVLAGSKPGDTVLDPFAGSGTTGAVALQHGRRFIGCELNPAYLELARARIAEVQA
jgi:DNA modification methylase